GADLLEQPLQAGAVAHVGAVELRLRTRDARRLDVRDRDQLGVVASHEELDQPRTDVARAARDHVLHAVSSRRSSAAYSSRADRSLEPGTRPLPLLSTPATWRSGYAAACKAVYTGSIPVVASRNCL